MESSSGNHGCYEYKMKIVLNSGKNICIYFWKICSSNVLSVIGRYTEMIFFYILKKKKLLQNNVSLLFSRQVVSSFCAKFCYFLLCLYTTVFIPHTVIFIFGTFTCYFIILIVLPIYITVIRMSSGWCITVIAYI